MSAQFEWPSVCGAITAGTFPRRNRCMETDLTHRGPHWKNVEAIDCECQTFCHGHETDDRSSRGQ